MMHPWNTQTTSFSESDRRKLSDHIHTQINIGNRSERRLALFATLIAVIAAIWIVFWITQLVTVGVVALRAKDFLPPIGIALITPAWVGILAATVSANYFIPKSRRRMFEDTLLGSVSRAKDQTSNQALACDPHRLGVLCLG